jgi:hypothetical protein
MHMALQVQRRGKVDSRRKVYDSSARSRALVDSLLNADCIFSMTVSRSSERADIASSAVGIGKGGNRKQQARLPRKGYRLYFHNWLLTYIICEILSADGTNGQVFRFAPSLQVSHFF